MLTLVAHAAGDTGGEGLKVVIPLIASAVALFGVVLTLVVNGLRADRNRRRDLYSAGWAVVQAYRELAFAIRRRNVEDRAAERVRLSDAMGAIQKELSYYEAMIGREGVSEFVFTVTGRDHRGAVAAAYLKLVAETRKIAGGIVRRSWNEEPISQDREMHAPDIATELQALQPVEGAFLDAVNRDVGGRPGDSRSGSDGAG